MSTFQIGANVKGHYFNVPFSGVINHIRPHTMNNLFVVHIDLDSPISVFDDERNRIAMEVTEEGCMAGAPGRVMCA